MIFKQKIFFLLLLLSLSQLGYGQFGKNKVQYQRFDFRILQTPNWDIYHYLDDSLNIKAFAEQAEVWHTRHNLVFNDKFPEPSPIILHNNHADFQQTTVIDGMLGTSTGGVTEGLRNRVVMPYLQTNRETDHVLGHEMVHVFQYRMFKQDDSLGLGAMMYMPLWMIEGLAEYLSIGSVDQHTAMWMRDAVQQNDIPTIDELTFDMQSYFPYRYGHAVWAFMTSMYGDSIIAPLMRNTGMYGYDKGIKKTIGITKDSLSVIWREMLMKKYSPWLDSTYNNPIGEVLFDKQNSGDINISPVVSPDGENIIFMSDKEVLSLDIFLANPKTKTIIKKISGSVQKSYIDEYKYFGSTGSWSPDNRYYAMATFIKGQNRLVIIDPKKQKIVKRIKVPELDAFSNPAWSPDGENIIMSGLKNGQADLYLYHLKSEKTTKLTSDRYSDIQPEYSPDGKKILFISDRGSDTDLQRHIFGTYRICELNITTGLVDVYDFLPGANNVDPQFSPDGKSVYFLSDYNGFRNLFEFDFETAKLYQLTNFFTGISGITDLSPAISLSNDNYIYYTLFKNDRYSIYKAHLSEFTKKEINPAHFNNDAAQLQNTTLGIDKEFVTHNITHLNIDGDISMLKEKYKRKFKLEYVGSSGGAGIGGGIGAGIGQFDAAMYGSVQLFFGDILKRNQIYTALQVQGELKDIGGTLFYINKEHRFNWGVGVSHIPYSYISYDYSMKYYTFVDQIGGFTYYPISKKTRFEVGGNYAGYSYKIDSLYTDGNSVKRQTISFRDPFNYFETYVAFVGDDSQFGFTSPMDGYRYRIEIEKYFGKFDLYGLLLDYRKYYFLSPTTLGFRVMHYGKYGESADWPYKYFLGNDFYFLKGYNTIRNANLNRNNIAGTKFAMVNTEFRIPFSGHERLSIFSSKYLYADWVMFFEGGLAWQDGYLWSSSSNISFKWEPSIDKRVPIYSIGTSLRINLFGMIILEPYYAFPFQDTQPNGVWGVTFSGGGW